MKSEDIVVDPNGIQPQEALHGSQYLDDAGHFQAFLLILFLKLN